MPILPLTDIISFRAYLIIKEVTEMTKKLFNKKSLIYGVVSLTLFAAIILSSAFAWLKARDDVRNSFTLGDVKVELWENFDTNFNGSVERGEIYGPDDPDTIMMTGENKILPSETVIKQPYIKNTGKNDAYVYMSVGIPKDDVVISSPATGEIDYDGSGVIEVFSLEGMDNENWSLVSSDPLRIDDNYNYYLYAYNKPLPAGEDTENLFGGVKYANVVENFINNDTYSIPEQQSQKYIDENSVSGFGINGEDLYKVENFGKILLDKNPWSREQLLNIKLKIEDLFSGKEWERSAGVYYLITDDASDVIAVYSGENVYTTDEKYGSFAPDTEGYNLTIVSQEEFDILALPYFQKPMGAKWGSFGPDYADGDILYVAGNDKFDILAYYQHNTVGTESATLYNVKETSTVKELFNSDVYDEIADIISESEGTTAVIPDTEVPPGFYYMANPFYFANETVNADTLQHSIIMLFGLISGAYYTDDLYVSNIYTQKASVPSFGYKMPINAFAIQTTGLGEKFESGNDGRLEIYKDIIHAPVKTENQNAETVNYNGIPGVTFDEIPENNTVLLTSEYNLKNMEKVPVDYHDIKYYSRFPELWNSVDAGYVRLIKEKLPGSYFKNHVMVSSDSNGMLTSEFADQSASDAVLFLNENEPNNAEQRNTDGSVVFDYTKKAVPVKSETGVNDGYLEIDWLVNSDGNYETAGVTLDKGLWAFYYIDDTGVLHTFAYSYDGYAIDFDNYELVYSQNNLSDYDVLDFEGSEFVRIGDNTDGSICDKLYVRDDLSDDIFVPVNSFNIEDYAVSGKITDKVTYNEETANYMGGYRLFRTFDNYTVLSVSELGNFEEFTAKEDGYQVNRNGEQYLLIKNGEKYDMLVKTGMTDAVEGEYGTLSVVYSGMELTLADAAETPLGYKGKMDTQIFEVRKNVYTAYSKKDTDEDYGAGTERLVDVYTKALRVGWTRKSGFEPYGTFIFNENEFYLEDGFYYFTVASGNYSYQMKMNAETKQLFRKTNAGTWAGVTTASGYDVYDSPVLVLSYTSGGNLITSYDNFTQVGDTYYVETTNSSGVTTTTKFEPNGKYSFWIVGDEGENKVYKYLIGLLGENDVNVSFGYGLGFYRNDNLVTVISDYEHLETGGYVLNANGEEMIVVFEDGEWCMFYGQTDCAVVTHNGFYVSTDVIKDLYLIKQ